MTPQQTDFQTWKLNPDQPLPESLENALLERCLEELEKGEKARNRFNKLSPNKISGLNKQIQNGDELFYCMFTIKSVLFESAGFNNQAIVKQFIQTLLSRTPDGKAVMPFLDVAAQHLDWFVDTLDYVLYREFTEALRVGKTLNEALEKITKTYLLNLYV